MPLHPGTTVGPYVVRSALGAGGMGEVYAAHDPRLNRDVALKILPASYATDPERLRRFEQESKAASGLNHPAIVTVFDVGHVDSHPFICMELVRGNTLRELLANGALPLRKVLAIAAQVADGLAKAHEAGIVHRDLKPDNIMVTGDGFAKILDFGLAKVAERTSATDITVTAGGTDAGTVLGTAGYMSPEQAAGLPATTRSDQFSLGAVLYEMVTGRRAFDKPTTVETLSAIVREDVVPIQSIKPAVPAPVAWIIERCLQKDLAERYASTLDLARDLATARDRLSEVSVSDLAAAGGRKPRSIAFREAAAWTVAAALAVALATSWARSSTPTPASNETIRFNFSAPIGSRLVSTFTSSPFAISPDGRQIVYMAAGATGRRSLWLRSTDSLQVRPLPGTEDAESPFWSPDGMHLAFFAGGALKRTAIAGADSITLADVRVGGGAGGTWGTNDVIVFAGSLDSGLSRVAATGGTVTTLTSLDESRRESAHLMPLFLPDGRHILFQVMSPEGGTYITSLDAPAPRRLLNDRSRLGFGAGHLFFMRGRTLMAQQFDLRRLELAGEPIRVASEVEATAVSGGFAVSSSGTIAFWPGALALTQPTWVSRTGAVLGTVGSPAAYGSVALSPDGAEVAAERYDSEPGIWRLDLRGTATRATSGGAYQSTPIWRPDGRALVFAMATQSPPSMYLKRLDVDNEPIALHDTRFQAFPQGFTPDMTKLLFVTIDPASGNDIWMMDLSGEPGQERYPVTPLIRTKFNESTARISPDGKWLAYRSDESGQMNVYIAPLSQVARKRQVSMQGGRSPVWSRDGRELFYIGADGSMIAVSVSGSAENGVTLGLPMTLFQAAAFQSALGNVIPYDVARDGRFLINRLVERTNPPATVIVNWAPPGNSHTP